MFILIMILRLFSSKKHVRNLLMLEPGLMPFPSLGSKRLTLGLGKALSPTRGTAHVNIPCQGA